MKRILIRLGLLGSLMFIIFFFYHFKTSRRFRQSIISAFVAASLFFSRTEPAKAGLKQNLGSDKPAASRPARQGDGKGLFGGSSNTGRSGSSGQSGSSGRSSSSQSSSSSGSSASGNPGDDGDGNSSSTTNSDGIPKFPKVGSVQEAEDRLRHSQSLVRELEDLSDSETEDTEIAESAELKNFRNQVASIEKSADTVKKIQVELDENGKPDILVEKKDGTKRRVMFGHTRDKYYHEDVFEDVKPPDNFDNKIVRKMDYDKRLEYLRKNIPDENVMELQLAVAKSLVKSDTLSVPGFIGKNKEPGILDINLKDGVVSFTQKGKDKHRSAVKMSPQAMKKLAETDFHLFPDP